MRRFYPLPADESRLWPHADDISGVPGVCQLGRRILDNGLSVTWGSTPNYWIQVDDPTSPRGRVWRLKTVCWLAVKGSVPAPRPGLYAAFFRVRQPGRGQPLLRFSAEWKASAKSPPDAPGFLQSDRRNRNAPPSSRQESEEAVSWTHHRSYHEENPGGWLLCHVGNIVVPEPGEHARRQEQPQRQQQQGAGAADGEGGDGRRRGGEEGATDVLVSFGGTNDWCKDLDVDFAAIAPIRLSWDIVRVLMIGHRKGHNGPATAEPNASGAVALGRQEEEQPVPRDFDHAEPADDGGDDDDDDGGDGDGDGDDSAAPDAAAAAAAAAATTVAATNAPENNSGGSPISRLPHGVLLLVLEFSQPTLVPPRVETEPQAQVDRLGAARNGSGGSNVGSWEVF